MSPSPQRTGSSSYTPFRSRQLHHVPPRRRHLTASHSIIDDATRPSGVTLRHRQIEIITENRRPAFALLPQQTQTHTASDAIILIEHIGIPPHRVFAFPERPGNLAVNLLPLVSERHNRILIEHSLSGIERTICARSQRRATFEILLHRQFILPESMFRFLTYTKIM